MEGLPDGAHKEASRICTPSVSSKSCLLCSQPLPGPWLHSSSQYSGWKRQKSSWAMSYMAGKPGSHSLALTFPHWRTHVPKGSSLALSCTPWSRGYGETVLVFFIGSVLGFFAPAICWDFSPGLPDSHKATLCRG